MDCTSNIGFPQIEIPFELDWSYFEEAFQKIEELPSLDTLLPLDSGPLLDNYWNTNGNFHFDYHNEPSMCEDTSINRKPLNAPGVMATRGPPFGFGGNDTREVRNEIPLIGPIDFEISSLVSEGARSGSVNGRKRSVPLQLEEIQKYFDVPICRAAKELRVGLTVLKRRCRELNIMRWPQRKIKSLKSLINNLKELGLSNEVLMLEQHKRLLQHVPDMELTDRTKKLRQTGLLQCKLQEKKFMAALPD